MGQAGSFVDKGLFSHTYLGKILHEEDTEENAHISEALTDWWQSGNGVTDIFVQAALDTLGFYRKPGQEECVELLFEDFTQEEPISVCYCVPNEGNLDQTTKGEHWSEKLIRSARRVGVRWSILTNGNRWRLYHVGSEKPYETFFEVHFQQAVENGDSEALYLMTRFFKAKSFSATENEQAESLLDRYLTEGDGCRRDLELHLSNHAYDILMHFSRGLLNHYGQLVQDEATLDKVFTSAIMLLYRLLFLLYAESRNLLPLNHAQYRQHSLHSLLSQMKCSRKGYAKDNDYDLWNRLRKLFEWVNVGNDKLGIPEYDGGLFDNRGKELLARRNVIANVYLHKSLAMMGYVGPGDGSIRIDYRDLSVRHLGSLYEGLLEAKLFVAEEDLVVRVGKKESVQYLPERLATRKKSEDVVQRGEAYFAHSKGERKSTGSYYTPEPIVDYLVKYSVTDVLKERRREFQKTLEGDLAALKVGASRKEKRSIRNLIDNKTLEFVESRLLSFKVCDPAMGSGHFLVNVAHEITNLIVEVLNDNDWVAGEGFPSSDPVFWRRRVVENCLYGVDVNPLATELAKLSLWLTSLDASAPLTYLDHHLKTGNSLIGSTLEELERDWGRDEQPLLRKAFTASMEESIRQLQHINTRVTSSENDISFKRKRAEMAKKLLSEYKKVADYRTAIEFGVSSTAVDGVLGSLEENEILEGHVLRDSAQIAEAENFFHWQLEYPEVFWESNGQNGTGFDAVVGNPPWEVWKPNSQEFFEQYIPEYRTFSKQRAIKEMKALFCREPAIEEKWLHYQNHYRVVSAYFRDETRYPHQTSRVNGRRQASDINLYKVFVERVYQIMRNGGRAGMVVPSGIYTDLGTAALRRLLFYHGTLYSLYSFENRKGAFVGVHRSLKFVTLSFQKGGQTDAFRAAFYLHDVSILKGIDATALAIPVALVERLAPDELSIVEFNNTTEIQVFEKLYAYPVLGDQVASTWNVDLYSDLHMTSDSDLFEEELGDLPLYEGKMIWHYDHRLQKPRYWISEEAIRERIHNKMKRRYGKSAAASDGLLPYESYRVAFRAIASSTNERTMVSTILPKEVLCGNSLVCCQITREGVPRVGCDFDTLCFLTACLNSLVVDFAIRRKVTMNVNMFYVYQLPVPRLGEGERCFAEIVARVVQSLSRDDDFGDLVEGCTFSGIGRGATREQLQAEIDALVARLFDLSADELEYVLNSFPLVRKERKDQVREAFMQISEAGCDKLEAPGE